MNKTRRVISFLRYLRDEAKDAGRNKTQDLSPPDAVDRAAVSLDIIPGSTSALVAFGGRAGKFGMPPFEFARLTKDLPANRIFIRDLQQAWYHQGLPGIAPDLPGIASYLRKELRRLNVDRVLFVGNSMGGYAAILLGALVGVSTVHAFAPQTFIGYYHRLRYAEHRSARFVRNARRSSTATPALFDCRKVLSDSAGTTEIHIHYCTSHRLDSIHAERLLGLKGVYLHPCPHGGHNVVKYVRDTGELRRIFECELGVGIYK